MSAFATGEVITVSSAAVGLTAATYLHAISCFMVVQDQTIRWRADGTDPDASTGFQAPAGTQIQLVSYNEIANFRAISDGGASGDATLQIHYRK